MNFSLLSLFTCGYQKPVKTLATRAFLEAPSHIYLNSSVTHCKATQKLLSGVLRLHIYRLQQVKEIKTLSKPNLESKGLCFIIRWYTADIKRISNNEAGRSLKGNLMKKIQNNILKITVQSALIPNQENKDKGK